jgi:hypothetical protein
MESFVYNSLPTKCCITMKEQRHYLQQSAFLADCISHAWNKYLTALTIAVVQSEVSENLYIPVRQNSNTVFPG